MGKRFLTQDHVVATADGVVIRSGAVRPHPELDYDSHIFGGLVGLPWDPTGKLQRCLTKRFGQEFMSFHKFAYLDLKLIIVLEYDEL